jgi:ubiquitin carboxyl-terminal hydrolase 8
MNNNIINNQQQQIFQNQNFQFGNNALIYQPRTINNNNLMGNFCFGFNPLTMINNNNINGHINTTNNSTAKRNIFSLKELKCDPMIGLTNIGQTCYMNAVLQCLSHLYHITNYFLNPSKEAFINDTKTNRNQNEPTLSILYKELLEGLWKGEPKKPFSPDKFQERLGVLNPLFKKNNASDSKDFACFLIMQLHEELNLLDGTISCNQKIDNCDNIKLDLYDSNIVLKLFIKDFFLKQNSIITQYFYGINQNMFQCQNCKSNNNLPKKIKYSYENFFYIEFPLNEVRKHMMKNIGYMGMNYGMNYQNINQIDVCDCFKYYQSQNEIEGYCEICGLNNAKINMTTNIFSLPNILMIVFNRGKGLQYNIKINFSEILNLTNIVMNCKHNYELQSIVKHLGDNTPSGHFIAYCRSPIPNFHNYWFCYNDETVVQVNDFKSIVDIGVTYILFYQLKE